MTKQKLGYIAAEVKVNSEIELGEGYKKVEKDDIVTISSYNQHPTNVIMWKHGMLWFIDFKLFDIKNPVKILMK